ncbi:MAG: alpha/beta hydrolase, partial [Litorimonas sp.]
FKVEDVDPESLAEHRYVLIRTEDADGQPLGRLSAVSLTWLPDIAFQFQESLNLSPAELRVTQAVVTGQGLNALAKERGRAIGTLRNQLKSVLRKLGLSSQTELACLYSGYLRLARHEGSSDYSHSFRNTPWRRHGLFTAPDGGTVDYSEIGRADARPVLFCHPVILGAALAEPVRRAADAAGLRLISPLRPGFGKSSLDASSDGEMDRFARRLESLMDEQGIERIQIMGENTGFIGACHLAARLGERAVGLLGVSPVVPLTERSFFTAMARPQRNLYYIARYAPGLMPMIIRSIVAKCDSGFDEEWITQHFRDSPLDLELMEREVFKRTAREAYAINYTQGVEGMVREFNATGRDWSDMLDRVACPVTLTTGTHTGQFNPAILRKAAERRPGPASGIRVEPIDRAAYFVLHQRPEEVFRLLTDQFDAATRPMT